MSLRKYNLYNFLPPPTIRKRAMKYLAKFKKPEFGHSRRAYGSVTQRSSPIVIKTTPHIICPELR